MSRFKKRIPKKALKATFKMLDMEGLLEKTNNIECPVCKYVQHKRHKTCQFCNEPIKTDKI